MVHNRYGWKMTSLTKRVILVRIDTTNIVLLLHIDINAFSFLR